MGAMTLGLVIGLAAVVSLLVLGASRRALLDERQSVRHYQQTLDTLRSIGDRSSGRAPDVALRHQPAATARRTTTKLASSSPRTRMRAPDAPPASLGRSAPPPKLLFDDTASHVTNGRPTNGQAADPATVVDDGGGDPASRAEANRAIGQRPLAGAVLARSGRSAVSTPPIAAAAVVVIVVGVIVGAVVLSSGGTHRPPQARPATRGTSSHTTPVDTVLVPVQSASSFAATYRVTTASYVLQLTASNPCWVYATDSAGHVLWTGTLDAGQTQAVSAQGEAVVHLGAASNIAISAGGRKVQFPSGFLSPFVATFTTS